MSEETIGAIFGLIIFIIAFYVAWKIPHDDLEFSEWKEKEEEKKKKRIRESEWKL